MITQYFSLGRLELRGGLILLLLEAADISVRTAVRKLKRPPPKRGLILRPGIDTPLWNELVKQTLPLLKRRSSKAHLACLLGLARQRLNDFLKAKRACLNAERPIFLLVWGVAHKMGRELAP